MAIDYTKRRPDPPAAAPVPPLGAAPPAPTGRVTLTKTAPSVSLTKRGTTGGQLRVNLQWTAGPPRRGRLFGGGGGGIDLDLGCLYEFADGTKGVVQALGDAFNAPQSGTPIIRLDGDDRSGSNTAGENLFIDLARAAEIRRILVFAFIYDGAPNWAAADAVVTLHPVSGPQVEVRLDEARAGAPTCVIAMLENQGGELVVRREVRYIQGGQADIDRAYGWGMTWTRGRK